MHRSGSRLKLNRVLHNPVLHLLHATGRSIQHRELPRAVTRETARRLNLCSHVCHLLKHLASVGRARVFQSAEGVLCRVLRALEFGHTDTTKISLFPCASHRRSASPHVQSGVRSASTQTVPNTHMVRLLRKSPCDRVNILYPPASELHAVRSATELSPRIVLLCSPAWLL